jgi:hypothetical protein
VYFAGTLIGNLPMTIAYRVGDTFVLRAGRWRVLSVNDANHSLTVAKAPSAGAPRYGGAALSPSGLVAGRMKAIYEGVASGRAVLGSIGGVKRRKTLHRSRQ